MSGTQHETVVVGSGPNGLAAAITLAGAGRKVRVLEGKDKIGGGLRSADNLTLPGFIHDPCSAIHPLGIGSPFFRSLPLKELGVRWVFPPVAAAHPLDDGTAMLIGGRVETTASQFGRDARAYRLLMGPIVERWQHILDEFLRPAANAQASTYDGPVRSLRTDARDGPCTPAVSGGAGTRRVCRHGRAFDHAAGMARNLCVRNDACDSGSCDRLADGAGRVGENCRSACIAAAQAGRRDRGGPGDPECRGVPAGSGGAIRCDPTAVAQARRRPPTRRLSSGPGKSTATARASSRSTMPSMARSHGAQRNACGQVPSM